MYIMLTFEANIKSTSEISVLDKGTADGDDEKQPVSETTNQDAAKPKEHGGRTGPDPVRYGDWESKGRCIDF